MAEKWMAGACIGMLRSGEIDFLCEMEGMQEMNSDSSLLLHPNSNI